MIKMFSIHNTPEEFTNYAAITGHFDYVFEENSIREGTW